MLSLSLYLAAGLLLGPTPAHQAGRIGLRPSGSAQQASAAWTKGPSFELDVNTNGNGPSRLSDTLVVNGVAMSLVIACHESQISGTNWACTGGTLSERGSGASPVKDVQGTWTDGAQGVRASGTSSVKDYGAANTTFGDLTTQDVVIEYVGQWSAGYAIAKRHDAGAAFEGWALVDIGGMPNCVFDDGPTQINVSSGVVSTSSFVHVICFYDANEAGNGARAYVNGTGTTTVATNGMGSLTNGATMQVLGNDHVASTVYQATPLSSVRVWSCPGCFPGSATNQTVFDPVALERASRAWGAYANIAKGQAHPSTMSRASFKTCDLDEDSNGIRRPLLIGNNAMCTARRKELTGGEYVNGLLIEEQSTNKILRSQEFQTTWTTTNATIATDVVAAPDGTTTADAIIGSAVNNAHGVSQNVTLTAAMHVQSVWVKAGAGVGNKAVLINEAVGANGVCVRLSDCQKIANFASSTPTRSDAESWGDGWCRVEFTWTATAVSTGLRIFASDDVDSCASNDENYLGDGATHDVYVWGGQAEAPIVQPYASSYIATTTATVTRNRDQVMWLHANNAPALEPVTVYTEGLMSSSSSTNMHVAIGSGASTNLMQQRCEGANGTGLGVDGAATQWNPSAAGGCADGERHSLRTVAAGVNNVRFFRDGIEAGAGSPDVVNTDVFATINVTNSRIGSCRAGGACSEGQPTGLVSLIRIWPRVVLP